MERLEQKRYPKKECPFCGQSQLKLAYKVSFDRDGKKVAGWIKCLSCGGQGPIVKGRGDLALGAVESLIVEKWEERF